MSLFWRDPARIGVAARHLACAWSDPAHPHVVDFDQERSAPASREHRFDDALMTLLAGPQGARRPAPRRVRFVVSNDVARHWIVAPPPGVSSLRELRSVADARFVQAFGEAPDGWVITGDWRARAAFVRAAIPGWIASGIEAACSRAGVAFGLSTTLADLLALHGRQVAHDGWCCVRTPMSLAVMWLGKGLPQTLRLVRIPATDDEATMLGRGAQEVRREALRHARPSTGPVVWLDFAGLAAPDGDELERAFEGLSFRLHRLARRRAGDSAQAGDLGESMLAAQGLLR